MGGLTVLHELLVTLPHEDFLYLGDAARLPVRPAPAARHSPLRARDRRLARGARRQADRRRLQRGDLGCAAGSPVAARGSRRRRDHAGGARRSAGDAQPSHRPARDRSHGRCGTVRLAAPHARRRRRGLPRRVPRARAVDRERRPLRDANRRGGARVRAAAEGRRGRHGHPRLHALSVDPSDPPARLRPRRDARLLGRGDRPRGRRDARAKAHRERRDARGRLPLPDNGRARRISADGARFLQLPIDTVEHVALRELEAAA